MSTPSRSKFTPEARAGIIARVELGVSYADAAQAVGVKVPTAKTWLAKGRREESGAYRDFAEAVEAARDNAVSTEPGDAAELRRRVWAMVEAGSVEAAKLYHRLLAEGEPAGDPWEAFGVERTGR